MKRIRRQQASNGSFRVKKKGAPYDAVATTALAMLCLSGDGSTLDQGPHKNSLNKAVKWLVKQQRSDGRFAVEKSSKKRATEPLLSHALATLAVYEVGLLGVDNRYLQAAHRGIDFATKTRREDSTWPALVGGKESDLTTTLWMLHALSFGARVKFPRLRQGREEVAHVGLKRASTRTRRGSTNGSPMPAERSWLVYGNQIQVKDPRIAAAGRRVAAGMPDWDGATPLTWIYFGGHFLKQIGDPEWKTWREGVLRQLHAWLGRSTEERRGRSDLRRHPRPHGLLPLRRARLVAASLRSSFGTGYPSIDTVAAHTVASSRDAPRVTHGR